MKSTSFEPLAGLRSPWRQTVVGHILPQAPAPKANKAHIIEVAPGSSLSVLEYTFHAEERPRKIFLFLHGLGGSHRSNYISRFLRHYKNKNVLAFAMNLRNCGSGLGLSQTPYNAGNSEDLAKVLAWIRTLYPETPVVLCGFSLGANIILKYLAEFPKQEALSAIAISAPADLQASSERLSHPQNRFYDRYFLKGTQTHYLQMLPYLKNKIDISKTSMKGLRDFDEVVTAPSWGYANAGEYYRENSSSYLLGQIRNPCLIISSKDDPVATTQCFEPHFNSKSLKFVLTEHGGHVGFIGNATRGLRWADAVAFSWIDQLG